MSDRLKKLEAKIEKLERQVALNKVAANEDKNIYPIKKGNRLYVSATHWYYD